MTKYGLHISNGSSSEQQQQKKKQKKYVNRVKRSNSAQQYGISRNLLQKGLSTSSSSPKIYNIYTRTNMCLSSSTVNFMQPDIYSSFKQLNLDDKTTSLILYLGELKHTKKGIAVKRINWEVYLDKHKHSIYSVKTIGDMFWKDANNFQNEIKIYQEYINPLIYFRCCPNLLAMINSHVRYYPNKYPMDMWLAMEQIQNNSSPYVRLNDILSKDLVSHAANILTHQFLFQLLYTLTCFQEIGLQHNDLHLNNIFVDELTTPIPYISYRISKTTVIILTDVKYVPKIYDFDHSSTFPLDANVVSLGTTKKTKINSLYSSSHNIKFVPYLDFYKLICELWKSQIQLIERTNARNRIIMTKLESWLNIFDILFKKIKIRPAEDDNPNVIGHDERNTPVYQNGYPSADMGVSFYDDDNKQWGKREPLYYSCLLPTVYYNNYINRITGEVVVQEIETNKIIKKKYQYTPLTCLTDSDMLNIWRKEHNMIIVSDKVGVEKMDMFAYSVNCFQLPHLYVSSKVKIEHVTKSKIDKVKKLILPKYVHGNKTGADVNKSWFSFLWDIASTCTRQ